MIIHYHHPGRPIYTSYPLEVLQGWFGSSRGVKSSGRLSRLFGPHGRLAEVTHFYSPPPALFFLIFSFLVYEAANRSRWKCKNTGGGGQPAVYSVLPCISGPHIRSCCWQIGFDVRRDTRQWEMRFAETTKCRDGLIYQTPTNPAFRSGVGPQTSGMQFWGYLNRYGSI